MTTRSDGLRALALLVVVFVAGGAVGVAIDRAWWLPKRDAVPEANRERHAQRAGGIDAETIPTPLERLSLSEEEQRQLHAIARRWRPQAGEALARLRPIVSELENNMFAEMLCVISKDKQDRYLAELREVRADSVMIDKRFRLVRTHQCPAEAGSPADR